MKNEDAGWTLRFHGAYYRQTLSERKANELRRRVHVYNLCIPDGLLLTRVMSAVWNTYVYNNMKFKGKSIFVCIFRACIIISPRGSYPNRPSIALRRRTDPGAAGEERSSLREII